MILVKESKKLKMEKLMAFCSFQRIIQAILYKGNNYIITISNSTKLHPGAYMSVNNSLTALALSDG